MKRLLLVLTLLASMTSIAQSDLIRKYDRDTIAPEVANGVFFELNNGECQKITRNGASIAQGTSSKIKSKVKVELRKCKAHLIAARISSKLSLKTINKSILVDTLGRKRNIHRKSEGDRSFFKAKNTLEVNHMMTYDYICRKKTIKKRYVSTLRSMTFSPLASLFNGLVVILDIEETLLDVDSCLDLANSNTEVSNAVAESYREVEEELR